MAMPAKKGAASPDDIMSAAEMKPLLMLSKREPVNAAVGMTADKMGVILLNKKGKPRKVMSDLKAEAKKVGLALESASLRFGTAEVDTEVDSSLVRFRVNKEAPGMLGPKLKEHLKKAGFQKVEFVLDPGLEEEGEEEAEGEQAPDWGGLGGTLTGLVQKIATASGGDPVRQKNLVQLAATANTALKAQQDFAAASAAVQALQKAIEEPPSAQPRQSATGTVAYGKARLAWIATRHKIEGEVNKLRDQIIANYQADGMVNELKQAYETTVKPVLDTFDEELADKLDDAQNAANPEERAQLVAQARAALRRYQSYLDTDPLIGDLDGNPFVPLTIKTTVGTALAAVGKALA